MPDPTEDHSPLDPADAAYLRAAEAQARRRMLANPPPAETTREEVEAELARRKRKAGSPDPARSEPLPAPLAELIRRIVA